MLRARPLVGQMALIDYLVTLLLRLLFSVKEREGFQRSMPGVKKEVGQIRVELGILILLIILFLVNTVTMENTRNLAKYGPNFKT